MFVTFLIEICFNFILFLILKDIHFCIFLPCTILHKWYSIINEKTKLVIQLLSSYLLQQDLIKYINLPSLESYTALHFSSYRGNIDICEFLIVNGADIT